MNLRALSIAVGTFSECWRQSNYVERSLGRPLRAVRLLRGALSARHRGADRAPPAGGQEGRGGEGRPEDDGRRHAAVTEATWSGARIAGVSSVAR